MASVTMEECIQEEKDEPVVKLPNGKRLFFVAILYVLFCLDLAIRYGVNAILPIIKTDLMLTDTQVGMLGSCVFLGMAIFVMPISFIGENKSQRRAVSLCTILWSGVTILCGNAQSALQLALLRLGVGAGNSAFAPLSTAMITTWYKKSSWGKALGFYNTAMVIGGALGYVLFAALAESIGWRTTFYVVGGISLVLSLLTLLLPDNKKLMAEQGAAAAAAEGKKEEIKQVKLNVKDTAKLLLSNRALLTMCLAAGLAVMTLNIGSTFISLFYVNEMGMSMTVAASIVAIGTPVSLVAYPLGGAILDKWYAKDRRARMYMPMVCIALTAILFVGGYMLKNIPMIILANAVYGMGNTSFHTAAHELVPVWYKSVSYGIYVLFIQLLGAVGPLLGGIMSDNMGLQQALVTSQVFFAVSAVLLFIAGSIYIKYYNRAREEELATGVCPEN